jgi:hypothetical protein
VIFFMGEERQLATKQDLELAIAEFRLELMAQQLQRERERTRNLFLRLYTLFLGRYALIIASVFINHYWR